MTAQNDIPLAATGPEIDFRGLAQRLITAIGRIELPADDDVALLRKLAKSGAITSEQLESQDVPENAVYLFGSLFDALGLDESGAELESETDPDEDSKDMLDQGVLALLLVRAKDASTVHDALAWAPEELFVLGEPDREGQRVRVPFPRPVVPHGLTIDLVTDRVVASAESRDGLPGIQPIDGLPVKVSPVMDWNNWSVGQPMAEDVSQGAQLGDCWLLALFAAIARHDPGLISHVLPTVSGLKAKLNEVNRETSGLPDDGSLLALLWRQVDPPPRRFSIPQVFELEPTFARRDGDLMGALSRVQPIRHTWNLWEKASVQEGQPPVRYVEDVAHYRVIAWPALLEKAFAIYIDMYGQEGNGPPKDGYGVIATGRHGHSFLRPLYGPRIRQQDMLSLEPLRACASGEPGPVDQELALRGLKALTTMEAQSRRAGPGADVVLMTTSTTDVRVIDRLQTMLPKYADRLKTAERVVAAMTAVKDAYDSVNRMQGADQPAPADFAAMVKTVESLKETLLVPALNDMLTEFEMMEAAPTLLRDLILTLGAPERPKGNDRTKLRFLYCQHEYAVLDVRLAFTGNDALPEPDHAVFALISRLDAPHSTITLYNPHGQNSPNADHEVPGDTGRFTLTLERFLNVTSTLNYTTIVR
jgi:hypothetical protein